MTRYLDRAAAVVLIAALSWAAAFWLPLSLFDWGDQSTTPVPRAARPVDVAQTALKERPLFQQSRRIAATAVASEAAANLAFDLRYRLTGLISSTDGTVLAMVEDSQTKKVHRLGPGRALDGWTFAGFSEEGAVFQQGAMPDLVLKVPKAQ